MKRTLKIALLLFTVALLNAVAMAAVSVSVSPASAQVNLGQQLQFTATVTGTTDGIVIWSATGANCSGISCGEITSDGLYTAPLIAPNPAVVTIRATSLADVTKSATASVSVGTPAKVTVAISPTSATIGVNGHQQFFATVTGNANTAVKWTVSGTGCVSGSCGSISTSGLYTAPGTVPNPSIATVTATSVADSTKSASASVIIKSAATVSVSISPTSAQLTTGAQRQFSATVSGSTNTSVTWRVTGTGCSGTTCGTISSSGLYTAPSSLPNPPKVTITATAVAEPGQSASAAVTLIQGTALIVSPGSVSLKPGAQQQFTAIVSGTVSSLVTWSISGPGCTGITCGSINSSGLYTAPGTAPAPPIVTVTARLLSNQAVSGSATVSILTVGVITVTVSPNSVTLNPGAKQQFTALVQGTSNTAVTWSVTGFGCAGPACGTITTGGLYTAPSSPPNPSFVSITATSVADPTKRNSATATITESIAVNISPLTAQVIAGGQKQFTATVTGTAITGVTWKVSGVGCTGSACGTISTSGLYTAPTLIPNPAQVAVTAVANADGATSASAIVTITVPIVVSVIPTSTLVSVSQQEQFRVTVSGTTNKAVTWSVTGTGCSGAACGTITSAGLYTAPATIPNPANVKVTATSAADSSRSGSAIVTIAPSSNAKLKGPYAFQFSGFDANGVYQSVGSFTADGLGHLAGLEDINNTSGPSTSVKFSGTYQVGSDNRGLMNFYSPSGTHTFKFALDTLGKTGRYIEFDTTAVRGSGIIKRQDPTAFDPSVFAGGYVFRLAGMDSGGQRIGALGLIFPDGSGFISGSSLDVNDGGIVSPTFATFNGLYMVAANGRGGMMLTIPGFGNGVFNFVLYVVSANEFLLQSIDPFNGGNPIFNGPAEVQTGAPFLPSSFHGPSVFNLSGANGSTPDDTVGRFLFDNIGGLSAVFDENNGGKVTVAGQLTGADSVELNGRCTLNLTNPATGLPSVWYIYATAPNEGFLMDASTSAVGVGELKNQLQAAPSSNSDILGTYLFASGEPTNSTSPLVSGVSSFDGGNNILGQGSVNGTEDASKSSGNSANLTLSGTYSVSHASNNGRGAILLTLPSGETIAVWVINANQVIGLDVDSSETQPTILHFEQ